MKPCTGLDFFLPAMLFLLGIFIAVPAGAAEEPPPAGFTAQVYVINETARSAAVLIRRNGTVAQPLVLDFETADGTATMGDDYTSVAAEVSFAARQRTKAVKVPILKDDVADGGESVRLILKSKAGDTLATATLVLRERAVAIAPRKLKPGQRITVRGKFDPSEPLYIRFRDFAANNTAIRASEVTARSARVRVPVCLDATTYAPGAALVTVQAEQGSNVAGPFVKVPVAAPATPNETPGSFALEFLIVMQDVAADAAEKWLAIENQSGGAVDTQDLRAALATIGSGFAQMETDLRAVVDGTNDAVELGTIGTESIELNATGLATLDRMLVAAVFEGKFTPSTAGLARLRALSAQTTAAAAPLEPDPIGDFHDELNPTFDQKIAQILAKANSAHETAKTQSGKAFDVAEQYLGIPGVLLDPLKATFSATMYYALVVGPSVMAMTASCFGSELIAIELGRPVTTNDYQPGADNLQKGSREFLEEHQERLMQRLETLLAGRGGTLLDAVKVFNGVTDAVGQAIDLDDQFSVISKAFEAHATIYQNRQQPVVSIDNVTVVEPATGTRNAAFLVSLDRAFDQPVTITFSTAESSATPADFVPRSGTITIPKGGRAKFLTVAIRADAVTEDTEGFNVNLTAATNATIGKGIGLCTIFDFRRRWSMSANINAAGNDISLSEDFTLPRKGGKVSFALPFGARATVTVTETTMTVSGGGFRFENTVSVRGSGSGSAPIVEDGLVVRANGSISGSVRVTFDDGSVETYPITGSFSAVGTE